MDGWLGELGLFWQPLVGGLLVAGALGVLGVHVLLRRIVFVGIALSQWAAVGIGLSFLAAGSAFFEDATLLGFCRNHWVMAFGAELLGLAILLRGGERVLSREARIGIGWAVAGAVAVLCVARSAFGMDELKSLLTGEALFIDRRDLVLLAAAMVPATLLCALLHGRFLLLAFDRDLARSLGVRAGAWDALFYLLLGVALALSIHKVGVLFAVGFLTLPAAAALSLARRPGALLWLGGGLALLSHAGGFVASTRLDLPLGPSAVAAAGAVFALARAGARLRGAR